MSTTQDRQGQIITFYSFKGGTGRSMALANCAWILAQNQKKVLTIDWDLEAPGLHRYFYPFLPDKELRSTAGVIDLVLKVAMASTVPDNLNNPDWYLPHADITQYPVEIGFPFPRGGAIHFIPAGRQDAQYSVRITSFDWGAFYTKTGGGGFFEKLRESMRREYDYILIDSRTGMADTAGICTVQLPDSLVVCFTLNNQSIEGASGIARAVQELHKTFPVDRPLRIFPAAMRVERGELERLKKAREFYREKFDPFLDAASEDDLQQYWNDAEIAAAQFYAFEEIPACFAEKNGVEKSLLRDYEKLLKQVVGEEYRFPHLNQVTLDAVMQKFTRNTREVRRLDAFFQKLGPDQQNILLNVLLRLVYVPLQDIDNWVLPASVPAFEFSPSQKEMVDALNREHLVETTPEGVVQFVSSLNVAEWEPGRDWMNARREWAFERTRLREAMERWEASNRSPAGLLQGDALQVAVSRLDTDPDFFSVRERAFVTAGREEAQAAQRRRAELEASEITGWAKSRLQTEPEEAGRLALTALERASSREAQEILARALKRRSASWDFGEHTGGISYATFSPDESQVALAGLDGLISVWEVAGAEPRRIALFEHADSVMGLAYHPSEPVLLSGSWDKTTRSWTLASGSAESRLFCLEDDAVSDVAFVTLPGESGEPSCVVTALRGGKVVFRLYDSPDPFNSITVRSPLNAMFVDRSGEWIAFCSGRSHRDSSSRSGLQLLCTADLGLPEPKLVEAKEIAAAQWADFNTDSTRVAVSGFGSQVSVFRLRYGDLEPEKSIDIGSQPVNSVNFSPDGSTLVTATTNGKVQRWDVQTGKEIGQALNHPLGASCARYDREGERLLTAGFDGKARLWDLRVEGQIETLSASALKKMAREAGMKPLDAQELDHFRAAPRKWVLVIARGSIRELTHNTVSADLGELLARSNFGLIVHDPEGRVAKELLIREFMRELRAQRHLVDNYVIQVLSLGTEPDPSAGRAVFADIDGGAERKAVELCDAVVFFGSHQDEVAARMLRLAADADKPVLSLEHSATGSARGLIDELRAAPNSPLTAEQWKVLERIDASSRLSQILPWLTGLMMDKPSKPGNQPFDLGAMAWEAAKAIISALGELLP